jgi:hypothetical protein
MLGLVLLISMGIIFRSDRTMNDEFLQQYERTIRHHQRHHKGPMAAGLRGELVKMAGGREYVEQSQFRPPHLDNEAQPNKRGLQLDQYKRDYQMGKFENFPVGSSNGSLLSNRGHLTFHPPPPIINLRVEPFEAQDRLMYRAKKAKKSAATRRVFYFAKKETPASSRTLREYPSDFTDNTQFYGVYDSDDERLSHMEIRHPLDDGECVPMKDWQTTYYPSCNVMHELGMEHMGESKKPNFSLFGTKGYWRNAWKVNGGLKGLETIVLKTLK